MAAPRNFQTFRDPAFSLWQSALHETLLKYGQTGKTALSSGHRGLGITADHPYMIASVRAMQALQNQTPAAVLTPAAPVVSTVFECAKLAAEIAWDELFDRTKVPALKNELDASECDQFWAECLTVYAGFLASGQTQPYEVYSDINQYVLTNALKDNARVAVISDWGTGMNDAFVLLQQIATLHPDVVIHLGDIYYAGLPGEDSGHFNTLFSEVWPENAPLIFTLDGNHDRYAGAGGGYYKLIAGLNSARGPAQPNSYFALRNNFWQLLAMDTGYHDTNPFTVATNLTYLEQSEIEWHLDKIHNNGSGLDKAVNPSGVRGTVLFSHHPLLSFTGVGHDSAGRPLAVNPNLANAFFSVFHLVDFWLWGHEHSLRIFEPYTMAPGQPLPSGRCVGAGAVPVFPPDSLAPADLVIPPSESGPPLVKPKTSLGNNGAVFNHAYALITLNQTELTIDYYQFDSSDAVPGKPPAASPIAYSDRVAAPLAAKAK